MSLTLADFIGGFVSSAIGWACCYIIMNRRYTARLMEYERRYQELREESTQRFSDLRREIAVIWEREGAR